MTSTGKGVNERDDDEDDDVAATLVHVETCEIRITEIQRNLSKTTVFDLDNMLNINKDMSELNNTDDDASAVTVATKNLSEGKYNTPVLDIPPGFFDTNIKQVVNTSKKLKKPFKKKRNHKKKYGKQAMDSTDRNHGNKRERDGNQQLNQSNRNHTSNNSGTIGNNNSNNQGERGEMNNGSNKFNDE